MKPRGHGRVGQKIYFTLALLLLLGASASWGELSVIQLKHRTADDIIRIIRPHLGPGDSISGEKYVLFLNTTPENRSRIQSIISTLDQALRQLLITVVQGENVQAVLASVDAAGNLTVGDNAEIKFGRKPQPEDTVSVTGRDNQTIQNDTDVQQVRVQEGMPVRIHIGQTMPVAMGRTGPRQRAPAVEYRELRTGFEVLPRLSGDRFVLSIGSQRESTSAAGYGVVETRQIQTQVQGRLNEWIEIGGILGEAQRHASGGMYDEAASKKTAGQIFLKIIEIFP